MSDPEHARSAVRDLFADGEPRDAGEVAAATGLEADEVADALEDLAAVGELSSKAVGEGDRAVRVWYPAEGHGIDGANGRNGGRTDDAGSSDSPAFEIRGTGDIARGGGTEDAAGTRPVAVDVDEAVADLDVPGASEMMRSWRRDAVRAAARDLAEEGPTPSETIVDRVYPGHRAGYDDREAWWAFVSDALERLPWVTRDGDTWRFEPRD